VSRRSQYKQELSIPEKDIKRMVIKQLKSKFPFWRRLTKTQKKSLVEEAIHEVMASYQPSQARHVPLHELTNTPAIPGDIIPFSEMGKFIEDRTRGFLPFTKLLVNRLENKSVRAFLHLPLHKKILVHHSQLSQFRSTLTVLQMVNLMVYVTDLLVKEIKLPAPFQLCGADSTDLASSCCPLPLATLNVGQKKVLHYTDSN
jgi:hypothetical protein